MSLSAPQQRRGRQSPPPTLATSTGHGPLSGPSTLPASARAEVPHASSTSSTRPESDADAKLRLRDGPGIASPVPFGGRRGGRAGAMLGLRRREWIILGAVTVVACFVRLWNLAHPTSVV